jgi:hypothetical protein
MADKRITELPVGAPSPDDLVVLVDEMSTTPATKKATLADVLALAAGGGASDVLWTGPEPPTDEEIELWLDTDEPTVGVGVQDTLWEGPSPPTDPAIEMWVDTSDGSGSIVQAKGDLMVGTAPDTVARLVAGLNGQTLIADASQPTGIRWGTPPGGTFPFVPFSPFSVAGWTWVNQGGASVTEGSNIVHAVLPAVSANAIRGQVKALPAGTPTVTVATIPLLWTVAQSQAGIALRESATDKWVALFLTGYTAGLSVEYHKHTTATTYSTGVSVGVLWTFGSMLYLRFQITATQYVASVSLDGVNFAPVLTENKNAFFTTGPDQIGWAMKCQQTTRAIACSYLSWLET